MSKSNLFAVFTGAYPAQPAMAYWRAIEIGMRDLVGIDLDRVQTRRCDTVSRFTGGLLYSLFGQEVPPIEIQREIGARTLQNRRKLPKPVADLLSRVIRVDVPSVGTAWTPVDRASCLLIEGYHA